MTLAALATSPGAGRRGAPGSLRARPVATSAGLALVAALVGAGFALNRAVPSASPLLWAMGLGVLAAPLVQARPGTSAGVGLAATHLLRAGVALLGLRISVGELGDVGPGGIAVAAGTIASTLLVTRWIGRRLGVPDRLALLIATGSAVCGASAIAAMDTVARAREEDVGYAVATVTLFGTAAMLLLPVMGPLVGLDDTQTGMWAGGSIHEVAQATAAGAVVSAAALKVATLVKLCRVLLLAPTVALVAARARGRAARAVRVPGFVVVFAALVAVRSAVGLPHQLVSAASVVSTVLLAGGLAALGLRVRVRALRTAGLRPLLLGAAAWAVAAATALGLVLALG